MNDSEKLQAGLRALAREMEARHAPPPQVEADLVAAFRRRHAGFRRARRIAMGAIAASVLFLLASAVLLLRQPPAGPRPASRTRPEIVTGFLPVPGADLLAPLDHGRVVRIELPRSAMTRFGLPVNEDRAYERVRADVLLGEDGLARAIRFVQ